MNIKLIQHNDFKISQHDDSFKHSLSYNGTLYRVAEYIASKNNGESYTFWFGFNTLVATLHDIHLSSTDLSTKSLEIIKSDLDKVSLADMREYTYQYSFEDNEMKFMPVDNPVWRLVAPI